MDSNKWQEQRVADQANMDETPTNAKDTPLSNGSKKATLPELESIFETNQRINRLERR